MSKYTYAIGNKKGPVMFYGTIFKSQKDLNKYIIIAAIIIAISLFFILKSSLNTSSGLYTIEVSGTSGTEFTGSIGGGSSSRTVEGTVPASYTVSGWPAVAVIQKTDEYGFISVTIKKDGETLDSESTSASYGVVTVSSE